ncbi:prolyl 3-hydroxylase sudestada1 [Ostrinia nubilalis]|uniref:prolyl 3-hydroxylase sudestada1 n=1 Tax=Ostrinia nubilalis TaxID=29057 RepID=UPI0030825140
MSSPSNENEEPSSTSQLADDEPTRSGGESSSAKTQRPPAKRRLSSTVIEISDTESDDSDVCAVNSYQASADEVKRIRGADYSSSSSSSSDYSSDSESPWEDDSVLVEDEDLTSKPVKAQLNPRANRMDEPKLNPTLKAQELKDSLKTHWSECKDHTSNEVTLTCEPFRVCLLHNLLDNPEIINNIVDDMNTLDWSRKKMDLFEFHQTTDLASLTWQRSIRGIYELLKTEVMSWVSEVTGLELTSVSASCSLYGPGDHLLVHDDLLADRRVAFILYLSPWAPRAAGPARVENGSGDHDEKKAASRQQESYAWCESMGGALELLARDESGPTDVVRRVFPRNNMLAFFKVGVDSFHQVGEVLSLELPRLSINGWFHGPAPPGADPPPPDPGPPLDPPLTPHTDVVLLNQWVEPTYMSPRSRGQIQAQMERESEVCLRDLLLPDKHRQVLEALQHPDIEWELVGPAHQRRYERVSAAWLARAGGKAGCVRELLRLAGSSAFCRLLADCSDLQLASYRRLELQRWAPACFTLLPPREQYQWARLEALLYLGAGGGGAGGGTLFVAPEEGGAGAALVSVPPADNALSLVYCDAGAASFTKYVSRLTTPPDHRFYILTCTYAE